MRIIPVIDVRGGVVVRAVGGRREEYRPLKSRLANSTDPVEVARNLLEVTGAEEVYVADLDAITQQAANIEAVMRLADSLPVQVLVDSGVRTEADIDRFPAHSRLVPVMGSETLDHPEVAGAAQVFEGACAFSVDLFNGDLLGRWERWIDYEITGPRSVAEMARAGYALSGASTVLLIDLANVGLSRGTGTESYCQEVRAVLPKRVKLIVGGGIRDWDDVKRLEDAGADAVLVASALHDGTLRFPRPTS